MFSVGPVVASDAKGALPLTWWDFFVWKLTRDDDTFEKTIVCSEGECRTNPLPRHGVDLLDIDRRADENPFKKPTGYIRFG